MPSAMNQAVSALSLAFVLFHVYVALFGPPADLYYLPVHLCFALALLFTMYPLARARTPAGRALAAATDIGLVAGSMWVLLYILAQIEEWDRRWTGLTGLDSFTAILLIVLVMEAVRRTVGWAMVVVAGVFVTHALFADRFPGILYGPPVTLESLLQTLILGDAGIFGIPVRVMAQYVVVFLLFAQLLQSIGAGAFFTKLAFAAFGHRVGGPAKAAVVSSGLFGTFSGSGVSNVLTTGAFTIPMMMRLGYRPAFSGGVEAAAAVGGTLTPPVMGAVAFIMAEFMGVPFLAVALAAVLPAFLYYVAIYCTVHFEARKIGIGRLDRSSLPRMLPVLAQGWYLMVPVAGLVLLLVLDFSIARVALIASGLCLLVSFIPGRARLGPIAVADACVAAVKAVVALSATCACAGIIIGAIFATGLSFQVTQSLLALSSDQMWILLTVGALAALLLGTGLTASAVYITMVATIIPILKAGGVPEIAAHMFAFYYGVIGDITPPTALAAVAAAGLAGANPMATMLQASRIGIAAFFVPLMFVYSPALLMIGSPVDIVVALATAIAGLVCLTAALAGHLIGDLARWQRLLLAGGFVCLVVPSWTTRVAGAAILALMLLHGRARHAARPVSAMQSAVTAEEMIRRIEAAEAPASRGIRDGWRDWAVACAAAVALAAVGQVAMHARHPELWLAALLAIGVFATVAMRGWLQRDVRRLQVEAE